jgi:prepilin-type N-terminal cleavage/methylation domain-containing protein
MHAWKPPPSRSDCGFTLVEVLIALALIAMASAGVAQLCAIAIRNAHAARDETMTTMLAMQKIEQLRSAPWASSDLALSPPGALAAATAGYADFLDRHGQSVGALVPPPVDAVYLRRWSIEPLPAGSSDTRVVRVLVSTVVRAAHVRPDGPRARHATESLIVALRSGR